MFKLKSYKAIALIFVIVMLSAILMVATRGIENVMEAKKNQNNPEYNTRARFAAESLGNLALLAIKDAEAGYEPTGELPVDEYNEEGTTGTYTVYSRAQENSNDPSRDFYTPIPYSGTAGPSEECDLYLNFNPEKDDLDPGHACNWNKLRYGESVTIPLYSYDGNTGTIKNPADLGLRSWSLKVRTPCVERVYDEDCGGSNDRYVMREDDDGNGTSIYDEDSSVILWQLIGENTDGDNVLSMVPDDDKVRNFIGTETRNLSLNTEIYESLINDQINLGDYIVLEASTSESKYEEILNACNDTTGLGIEKLFLQLDIITPLKDENNNSIPYLEWQLVTDSNEAFADNKAIVIGQGLHEGQKNNFIYNYVVTRTTVGERASIYTVSN